AEQEAAARSQREQADLQQAEALRLGTQQSELYRRLRALDAALNQVIDEAASAAAAVQAEQHVADAAAAALNVVSATLAELARQMQAAREEQFALVSRAAQTRSTAEMTEAQVDRLQK